MNEELILQELQEIKLDIKEIKECLYVGNASVELRHNYNAGNGSASGLYTGGTSTTGNLGVNNHRFLAYSCGPGSSHEIAYAANYSAGNDVASATAINYAGGTNTGIGYNVDGAANHFGGGLEEVRIISGYKTANWIMTAFNSMYAASTFMKSSVVQTFADPWIYIGGSWVQVVNPWVYDGANWDTALETYTYIPTTWQ